MQLINLVDTILTALESADRFTRNTLSILCWVIGRVIDILSSRRALRVYATIARLVVAFVRGFIYCCNCAIESGRIVAEGYYGIDEVTEPTIECPATILALPTTTIASLLPPAPEPAPVVLITPPPADCIATVSFPQLAIDTLHPIIPVFLDRNGKPLKGRAYQQRLKKVLAIA